jgi:hypothetical protein
MAATEPCGTLVLWSTHPHDVRKAQAADSCLSELWRGPIARVAATYGADEVRPRPYLFGSCHKVPGASMRFASAGPQLPFSYS